MKNFFFTSILIILLISSTYPQWRKLPFHIYSKSVIITMHGGATFADTDYDKLGANVFGEGSIQFFFKSRSRQGEYNIAKEIAVSNNVYSDGNLFCVQHSSWQTEKKAKSVAQTLIKEGYNAFVVAANIPQWSQIRYRVRVGYYNTLDEARKIAAKFR